MAHIHAAEERVTYAVTSQTIEDVLQSAFFVLVRSALVSAHSFCKHISTAVNQHATIEEEVFSVGAALRLYNKISGS
jgi:hypothetical protein